MPTLASFMMELKKQCRRLISQRERVSHHKIGRESSREVLKLGALRWRWCHLQTRRPKNEKIDYDPYSALSYRIRSIRGYQTNFWIDRMG
jgi:hypothetical protein